MIGVYEIRNLINGKRYIGSSVNIKMRWKNHRDTLNGNRHRNVHLQNAWNLYGKSSFEFLMLEEATLETVRAKEKKFIESLQPEYNLVKYVDSAAVFSEESRKRMGDSHRGTFRTEETKRKMSEAAKGKPKPAHVREILLKASTGRVKTPEEIQKRIDKIKGRKRTPFICPNKRGDKHPLAKLSSADVLLIVDRYGKGEKIAELAREFKVTYSSIKDILTGKNWSSVTGILRKDKSNET